MAKRTTKTTAKGFDVLATVATTEETTVTDTTTEATEAATEETTVTDTTTATATTEAATVASLLTGEAVKTGRAPTEAEATETDASQEAVTERLDDAVTMAAIRLGQAGAEIESKTLDACVYASFAMIEGQWRALERGDGFYKPESDEFAFNKVSTAYVALGFPAYVGTRDKAKELAAMPEATAEEQLAKRSAIGQYLREGKAADRVNLLKNVATDATRLAKFMRENAVRPLLALRGEASAEAMLTAYRGLVIAEFGDTHSGLNESLKAKYGRTKGTKAPKAKAATTETKAEAPVAETPEAPKAEAPTEAPKAPTEAEVLATIVATVKTLSESAFSALKAEVWAEAMRREAAIKAATPESHPMQEAIKAEAEAVAFGEAVAEAIVAATVATEAASLEAELATVAKPVRPVLTLPMAATA